MFQNVKTVWQYGTLISMLVYCVKKIGLAFA